ncbi:E2-like conjugating enzyme TDEL_0G01790 [Torulaspora delbrueckii]|uniref:Autophagy-related protein 10 n=1 Tax=Torulaspora delbrueckii TaxID=4950 RepID=G8ZYS1_TORDE|nr:hypothetical protein TDEL_0G01790 [Torulaspora delbrueckii]CCE93546.1 hypothetical protein TDEL_0G01790 [Torulaspora delbrueckii]
MISYQRYCDQLHQLYDSKTLQNQIVVQVVRLLDDSILLQTAVPSTAKDLSHLELKITYSQVYQEPLLLLRVWRKDQSQEDESDFVSLWFPQDVSALLGIDKSFQLELDAVVSPTSHLQETWYSIHPCDTAEIVGDQAKYADGYLNRWLSVFLFSWLI